jgi:hypothetical protein
VALLLLVLVVAALVARGCGSSAKISEEEAIKIARPVLVKKFEHVQIRYLQQGIPARGLWAVSFYDGVAVNPKLVQVVLVDAKTGAITDDGKP